ncbi:hypothetical protein BS47DRAFT_1329538 [Hydnum rufescens UP504]|uniref:Pentatricopeptide repeat-containing protein n=1 Tax=Hydnum rufescens UP504 TaxID=1448309 RepID=A0A9P6DTN8_9AGAM|nr:hypothetical protein BS47DRAFT_1329538 [Hydnum rufescens UP504]
MLAGCWRRVHIRSRVLSTSPCSTFSNSSESTAADAPQRPSGSSQPAIHARSNAPAPNTVLYHPPLDPVVKELKNCLYDLLKKQCTGGTRRKFRGIMKRAVACDLALSNRGFCELLAQCAAHQREPTVVWHILHSARSRSVRLYHSAYENVAFQFAINLQWSHVLQFVDLGRSLTGVSSSRLLEWRVRACAELHMYAQLRDAVQWFTDAGLQCTRRVFEILVKSSISNRDIPWARRILAEMESHGYLFEGTTYNAILAGHRALGPSHDVEARTYAALRGLGLLDKPHVLNTLMQLCLDVGDIEGALRVLKVFQNEESVSPTLDDMYKIRILGSDGYITEESLNPFPPEPTLHPSQIDEALEGLSLHSRPLTKRPDMPRVFSLYSRMLSESVAPNEQTLSCIVRCYFTAPNPRFEDAVRLVAAAVHGPGTLPAAAFCSSFGVTTDELGEPFSNNHLPEITPTVMLFNSLLSGILQYQAHSPDHIDLGLERMIALLEEMRQVGVEPNAETLRIFLLHLDNDLRLLPRELMEVLRTLSTPKTIRHAWGAKPNILPTIKHLNIILRSIIRRERYMALGPGRKVMHDLLYNPQPSHKRRPEDPFQDRLIASDQLMWDPTAGLVDMDPSGIPKVTPWHAPILDPIKSLQDRDVKNDGLTFALRMQHDTIMGRSANRTLKAFRSAVDSGIIPTAHHYASLMKAYADRGDIVAANSIFNTAMSVGIVATLAMFTILIVGYGKLGKPDEAYQVFTRMRDAGVRPDGPVVDALASAYLYSGKRTEAREIILRNWSAIAPVAEAGSRLARA